MKEKAVSKIREMSGHNYVKLTNCGNTAIFVALYIAKKLNPKPFILIPDQGGWMTYKTFPKLLNFEVKFIKTDDGLIDLDDLAEKAKTGAALLFQSIAGYFVEQPVEEISKICHDNNCLVIQDVSGSLGQKNICKGKDADMMIGSFGRWKLIDVELGGFISSNDDHFHDNDALNLAKHNIDMEVLLKKLEEADARFNFLLERANKIKSELMRHNIVHRDKKGLNVIVRFKDDDEKKEITSYCKDNELEYTTCPRYIRLEDDAISIEVKRLPYKDHGDKE